MQVSQFSYIRAIRVEISLTKMRH